MSVQRPRAAIAIALVAVLLGVAAFAAAVRPWESPQACTATVDHPEWSVARRWDEALLDAIRRALPNPPVHARNLYHLSAAMWDAWAAYDPTADGVFVTEKRTAPDVEAARREAMSYAAYGILTSRFIKATGGEASLSEFADVMDSLCYPLNATIAEGDTPAALGNRIARTILAAGREDGSNEAGNYVPPDYQPVNEPLVVDGSAISMADPNRWQPLQIARMISQNGIPVTNGVQQAVGTQWGYVTGFALGEAGTNGTPIDPGPPPRVGDPATDREIKDQVVEVIRDSSFLDPADPTRIDISPGARGNNSLGTNDGTGRPINPATGAPYPPDVVLRADFGRIMAEFWADGPNSETPPGHWNVLANLVSDELDPNLRIGGTGPQVNRLEWDVKLYLALNGAVHDAAIASWGLKGYYDSSRPISLIRYMGSLGQSSDPAGQSYNPEGLPLVPDLIEVITAESTAPGQRHAQLKGHEGEIAVRAWRGNPPDPKADVSGVGWILATEWVPYQQPTFVTPSFPGYVSGHSTFSRAAAEVLAGFTGNPFFPGGVSGFTIKAGSLKFEKGPTTDIRLEWATYFDAADQAGQSRLWGGIHIQSDDFTGRRIGSQCGIDAWALAQRYYAGAVTP
ncbi:MAG: vanadium-dependent haloperoxidase [Chloroflexi bacterium]|nr:vanadium-dependent haloperoxidase [Chloroflexota bacterium]